MIICRLIDSRGPVSAELDALFDERQSWQVSTAEWIFEKTKTLPGPLQNEVLDFVEFLRKKQTSPEDHWAALSLTTALRGMEDEEWPAYSESDLVEKWQ